MVRHSNQLTLRDLDPRVFAEIERVARVEGLSINKAAAKILKIGAGIREPDRSRRIGNAVDRFVGGVSVGEAKRLSQSLRTFEEIDDELWK